LPLFKATSATFFTSVWKSALRETKSVSELISTTTPLLSAIAATTRPSAATRSAFLAALDRPFLRSQSTAASKSPSTAVSAALQSIMPAPVLSRSSLTRAAVIVAMIEILLSDGSTAALPTFRQAGRTRF
jgi:hypothetical protein